MAHWDAEAGRPKSATVDQLRGQIRRLHEARQGYEILRETLEQERRAFEEQHARLILMVDGARATAETEETVLRTLILRHFEETGDKAPAPGVGIRMVKVVEYQATQALEWAKANGLALQLDRKAFEKIAIASPLAIAPVRDAPQATIAQDLGKALREAQ